MADGRGGEMDDIVREFLSESRDNLDQFEQTLLEAERDPASRPLLSALFRSIHSIKSSCGFLGFARLEALVHSGETLLGRLRDGRLVLDPEVAGALLRLVDGARRLLLEIESSGKEGDGDHAPLIAQLDAIAGRATAAEPTESRPAEAGEPRADELEPHKPHGPNGGAHTKIRVDVGLLDRLMNLVGELVLARNQVVQQSSSLAAANSASPVQRLSLVTTELQETVMKTRMQPIGNVFSRFPRLARDLSSASGKQVRLQLLGRETELDKSIIEAIQDPLTHLVRNAIDHGIEAVEQRRAAGKPDQGSLVLRAFHEGGMVNLEIADDGAGIDVERVRRRAVQLNLVSSERAARMSDKEALGLLFLPGLTTATAVTTTSGRGVGMDVVRTNVEKIGGTVDVHTRIGQGTTIKIKIPLTLAIIPALIVASGGVRYAIPQATVLEVVRLDAADQNRRVEIVQGAPVLRLRGKLLPIAYLNRELEVGAAAPAGDSVAIVVLQADERAFGLVVDEIRDTEEIVVKPLWKRLKGLACYAGATVMGDGRVALILDSLGLGQRVGVSSEGRQRAVVPKEPLPREQAGREDLVLLCRLGREGRLAIPLSKVARLEEFERSRLESVGGTQVAQYRGQILPLMAVAQVLQERRLRPRDDGAAPLADGGDAVQVVVFAHEDRQVGLVVDGILDIVGVRLALQKRASRAGVLGTMVVQDRVTEFLDVDGAMRAIEPATREGAESARAEG